MPELALFAILDSAGLVAHRHERVAGIEVDALVEHVAIFVDSPFWHLRDAALLGRLSPHWQERLLRNRRRDRRQSRKLRSLGYRVVRFWTDHLNPADVERRVLKSTNRRRRQ